MDWTLIVIAWFACAVFCAYMAPRKGNDQVGSFVGGLLLGPIAVVLTVLQKDKPA